METPTILHPTPLWPEHLPDSVYPPSEDTFLLIDALESEIQYITELNPSISVELGCGSGIVINYFKQYCAPCSECFAVDINPEALSTTLATSMLNHNSVELIQSDLFTAFGKQMEKNIDVILFNPPYVPTDEEELATSQISMGGSSSIVSSWAGGRNGMEVTWRFLNSIDRYLSPNGTAYVVLLSTNNPRAVRIALKKKGFNSTIVLKRKAGIELLYIVKITRLQTSSSI